MRTEANVDIAVSRLLTLANIQFDAQGSRNPNICEALSCASKNGTGNPGYPEYVAVIDDFVIVIEDKANNNKHIKLKDNVIDNSQNSIVDYAVNGAVHYAKAICNNSAYKKVFAFGISGEEHLRITPVFVNDEDVKILDDVQDFLEFSPLNIKKYYCKHILNEDVDICKNSDEIVKDAAKLHEYLRNFGQLSTEQKPIIVSGILLALSEIDSGNLVLSSLKGNQNRTDGQKIYDAIVSALEGKGIANDSVLLTQYQFLTNHTAINAINPRLGKTPIKFFLEFIYDKIYKHIRFCPTSQDILGMFYSEFISYSGGDGQSLGIIMTPTRIAELFCKLINLNPTDKILDPCCGTGSFLISAMNDMILKSSGNQEEIEEIKNRIFGFELQSYMYTISKTNIMLRNGNPNNIYNYDFFKQDTEELRRQGFTVGMINPPYSQGSKEHPELYELGFIERLLACIQKGGHVIAVVPRASLLGETSEKIEIKRRILCQHQLEAVIDLNDNTFYGVGVQVCIVIFKVGFEHTKETYTKFIDFKDDGYIVKKHIGLVATDTTEEKETYLLNLIKGNIDNKKICVKTNVSFGDDWKFGAVQKPHLIPTKLSDVISDYVTFTF